MFENAQTWSLTHDGTTHQLYDCVGGRILMPSGDVHAFRITEALDRAEWREDPVFGMQVREMARRVRNLDGGTLVRVQVETAHAPSW